MNPTSSFHIKISCRLIFHLISHQFCFIFSIFILFSLNSTSSVINREFHFKLKVSFLLMGSKNEWVTKSENEMKFKYLNLFFYFFLNAFLRECYLPKAFCIISDYFRVHFYQLSPNSSNIFISSLRRMKIYYIVIDIFTIADNINGNFSFVASDKNRTTASKTLKD